MNIKTDNCLTMLKRLGTRNSVKTEKIVAGNIATSIDITVLLSVFEAPEGSLLLRIVSVALNYAHLIIFTWNLRTINFNYYYYHYYHYYYYYYYYYY